MDSDAPQIWLDEKVKSLIGKMPMTLTPNQETKPLFHQPQQWES
jgi:hypothetical protein